MTIEQFDEIKWTGGMRIKYREKEYDVCSVDFIEKLVAFNVTNDEDLHWARCENVTLIP